MSVMNKAKCDPGTVPRDLASPLSPVELRAKIYDYGPSDRARQGRGRAKSEPREQRPFAELMARGYCRTYTWPGARWESDAHMPHRKQG